jgi:hypothetical protein
MDFFEFFKWKYLEKIQIWLNWRKNIGHFNDDQIMFIFAGNIKSLRKIFLRVKLYQVDGISDEV